jgi:pilus assembly protein Flp/PilA
MSKFFSRFIKNESGATAIEYGLIAGLLAVGIIAAVGLAGDSLDGIFTAVSTALTEATPN